MFEEEWGGGASCEMMRFAVVTSDCGAVENLKVGARDVCISRDMQCCAVFSLESLTRSIGRAGLCRQRRESCSVRRRRSSSSSRLVSITLFYLTDLLLRFALNNGTDLEMGSRMCVRVACSFNP